MIVEFIGLPGSGKSTLSQELLKYESVQNYSMEYNLLNIYKKSWVVRNLYKALNVVIYILMNKTKSLRFINKLLHYGQYSVVDFIRLTFNNLFLFSIYDKHEDENVINILDEGAIHHIWAIANGAKNEIKINELLEFYKLPNLIIYIRVDDEVIRRRNENREKNGNKKYKLNKRHMRILSNISNEKKRIENYLNKLRTIDSLKDNLKILTLTNNSIDELEKQVDFMIKEINNIIEEGPFKEF